MSALESPTTLTSAWQDPWSAVTSAAATVHMTSADDFYGNSKPLMPFGMNMMPVQPHMHHMHPHHHHMMADHSQNNNNNSMNNSDANSSSTTSSTASNKVKRQVNFKLDIKAEPQESESGLQCHQLQIGGMQKVPSISDLSDPESSLDIPCNQVRSKKKTRTCFNKKYGSCEKYYSDYFARAQL
jgi:hypothetical protein